MYLQLLSSIATEILTDLCQNLTKSIKIFSHNFIPIHNALPATFILMENAPSKFSAEALVSSPKFIKISVDIYFDRFSIREKNSTKFILTNYQAIKIFT